MMLTFFINSFYNMKNILNLKERGRSSVGRYHTKQQTLILEYLALKKDTAFTAESVWRGLLGVEEKVGRATVYRALDRLVEAGTILKIPSGDGNRALYRYMGEAALPSSGRMVCLDCGYSKKQGGGLAFGAVPNCRVLSVRPVRGQSCRPRLHRHRLRRLP